MAITVALAEIIVYLSDVDCITIQGASQNLKAPPNALPTGRAGNISCPSGNIAANQDSHLTSAQVVEKSAFKDESFNKAGIPSDQKTLKVRIKMGSEKKAQKLAAIYSGLGLDFSPSSSLGNSPDESGGTLMVSQETNSKSPTRILQIITSNHVPGGMLISPLHDSVLWLLRKEKERPSRENKSIPLLKACQEHSSMLIDEFVLGNRKQLHEKKPKFLIGKSEELVESKHGNHMNVENGKTLFIKKKHETKIAGEESLPNDLKHTAPSSSVNISLEATARVSDVSAETNQNALRSRLISSDSGKEDSLESISGRSRPSGKKKKWDKGSSLDKKGWEQSVDNSNKNASLDLGDNVGSKCYQKSAPLKVEDDSKTMVGQIATFHVQNKISIPSKKEKMFEGKKSKGSKNTGEVADSMKESLRPDVGLTLKDTTSSSQGFSSDKDKIRKLKMQEDINQVQDNDRDALETESKQKWGQMGSTIRHFQNRPKDFKMEHNGYLDKSKVNVSGRTVDNHLSGVAAPDVVPQLYDKRFPSQTAAPAANAPIVIEENWVQCDRCQKWRLLPFDTRPEQLPEKWLCRMLNWLPGMNQCGISEDETTKALNALYQAPVAGNQNNPQNHVNGSMSFVTSAQSQHLDQNSSSYNSQPLSIQVKKNNGLKEVQKAGSSCLNQMSNSKKQQQRESLKSKSLHDMTQAPVEPFFMKKSTFEEKERLLVGDFYIEVIVIHFEHCLSVGETRKTKMKNKRESGPYAGSKKSKTEVGYTTDKHYSSNIDHGRVGLSLSTSFPTQADGRSMQNCNGGSNSGDVKHGIFEKSVDSVKKLVDRTLVSPDGGSLNMRICDKRAPLKKRKLDGWQDSQNGNELCMKEESSESCSRNEKKLQFYKIEGKQFNRNDGDSTPNRKIMDHLIGGIVDIQCIDGNLKLSKHKKKSSSQNELDGLDSSRRDSRTGRILIPATSSSSKVSCSRKTRGNFEKARDSIVESVSSSPMRTSYPEKLASTAGSGKDAENSGISSSGNLGRCRNGEGTFELAQSGIEMKEKVLVGFNPGSRKSSTLDYGDKDSLCKIIIRSKPSSRLGNSHVLNGDSHSAENAQHTIECSHSEDILNKECGGNALFSHKYKKVSTLQTKDNKSYAADKMKCSENEKNYSGRRNPSGQPSSDSRMGTQSNKKHDEFDVKSAAPCSKMGNNGPEQNVIQDFSSQTKVMRVEVRRGMPKSSLHSETESWQEKKGHRTVPEAEQGVVSDEVPVSDTSSVDVSKALKQPGKASSKNAGSPVRENSFSLTVTNALNDAKGLRIYADRLKSSGFVFESNEIYFQAALKFLGVAALLEASNSESGRHGDMNQMQVYITATKLCEMCAQEYEKCQEMAAATLAYKCLWVACMRIVSCKHSSSCRDLKELQATLQMVPQGESPSSSVSDVNNNLNNQAIVGKAQLAKGNVSHVAGTHAVVAINYPSFGRLLDFTQDVSFAMGASRKSQTCFVAATSSLEEAQNIEWIASVKKVIDFSFQDLDEFISLVQQAMQAISRSG
ncbi:Tetratricopeptide repeat-like superfamily protein [Hibiscus syriacus]|uniref:Tetratricopeptide repeat-like superfamily protein n=1 Tax=Hibiscus syriacus TaxID=106335 RepID=A0A6A2Y295_HIBSY|nr:Tetratricopeptide repeat-like superfamily protein [Hibiscus syriacus]